MVCLPGMNSAAQRLVPAQIVLVALDTAGQRLPNMLPSTWLRNIHIHGCRMPYAMPVTVLQVT